MSLCAFCGHPTGHPGGLCGHHSAGHGDDWACGTRLDSAIGELPTHYRAVIVLLDVEDLSMAEVARSVGITVAAAKSRAHRARLFLRKRLSVFMAGVGAAAKRRRPGASHEAGQ
jgi:hypothetical protein